MSSKAQITESIETLENGGENTASEVRAVFETFNNELFTPETFTETISFGPGFGFSYHAFKIGALVMVHGQISNLSGVARSVPSPLIQLPEKFRYTFSAMSLERRISRNGSLGGADFVVFMTTSGFNFVNSILANPEARRFEFVYFNNNNL